MLAIQVPIEDVRPADQEPSANKRLDGKNSTTSEFSHRTERVFRISDAKPPVQSYDRDSITLPPQRIERGARVADQNWV